MTQMSEKKHTEERIRKAWEEAFGGEHSQGHINGLMKYLLHPKPQLKPDCPVRYWSTWSDKWMTTERKHIDPEYEHVTKIEPLLTKTQVMEMAMERENYLIEMGRPPEPGFGVLYWEAKIAEATEVQDGE